MRLSTANIHYSNEQRRPSSLVFHLNNEQRGRRDSKSFVFRLNNEKRTMQKLRIFCETLDKNGLNKQTHLTNAQYFATMRPLDMP